MSQTPRTTICALLSAARSTSILDIQANPLPTPRHRDGGKGPGAVTQLEFTLGRDRDHK